MKVILNVILSLTLIRAFEKCPKEFEGLEGFCLCQDSRSGQDVWCPNSERPVVRFQLQPQALWVSCGQFKEMDMTELRDYLKNVTLSTSVHIVAFSQCPMPSKFIDVMNDMKLTKLEELRILYGYSNSNRMISGQFEGLGQDLERLHITNSKFKSMDSDTFRGLDNLKYLSFVENSLEEFPNDLLLPLSSSLQTLDISQPQIESVPDAFFRSLNELRNLKLHLGASPQGDLFKAMPKVETLELFNLDANQLSGSSFSSLTELKNLTFSGRSFSNLSEGLFASNQKLVFVEWLVDKCPEGQERKCVVQPPSFLRNVSSLETFRIIRSQSRGVVLNEDFFWGCDSLKVVKISRSKLKSLPENLFRDTKNLIELDLSFNQIQSLPSKIFHNLRSFQTFNVMKNKLEAFDDEHFVKADSLTSLVASSNNLKSITQGAFKSLRSLKTLDLSNNEILLDNDSDLDWSKMSGLSTLNLANNNISYKMIPYDFRGILTQLSDLNLSGNKIGPKLDVSPDFFFLIHDNNKRKVDLSSNNIRHLSYKSSLLSPSNFKRNKEDDILIDISNNPLQCDCHNVDLALHLRGQLTSQETTWFKYSRSDLKCEDKPQYSLESMSLSKMSCAFPSNDLEGACPTKCSCSYTPYQESLLTNQGEGGEEEVGHILVNCSGNPSFLPDFIPHHLNDIDVEDVSLDLSRCSLSSLAGLFDGNMTRNLTGLFLSHNQLSSVAWDKMTAAYLPVNLKRLALDHNLITILDYEALRRHVPHLEAVWLAGNPYQCDCDSRPLFRFVRRYSGDVVKDADDVTLDCQEEGLKRVIDIAEAKEFCVETKEKIVAIALPVALVVLVFLIILVLFLVYRDYIYVWMYSKPRLRSVFFSSEDNIDKKYDVFISYSHMDSDFVEGDMVPKLENDPKEVSYRCLFHVRDFVPGRAIMEQIVDAVDSSSCTLIVLSNSFVESEWARHEFDLAQTRSRIIVVVKGELPEKEKLPDGLHAYIKTNTYLSWTDPWFWQKLRYALPHKGAKARCFEGLFGQRRHRRKTDQLHLLQNGSRSLNVHQDEQNREDRNGFSSLAVISGGRHNSVSPV